ncbi:MAG: GNAT family N-acetyltransferase, partial [Proteobacteria bacterium]|nr:GNAT family N-acetyltransferase [Pseudomonadota bacterium]
LPRPLERLRLWAVRDFKIETGCFVGETGHARFGRGLGEMFDEWPKASWTIVAALRNRGLAYEAALSAHPWLEARRSETRTVCLVEPGNAASVRVAQKLGYQPFATATYRNLSLVQMERSPTR